MDKKKMRRRIVDAEVECRIEKLPDELLLHILSCLCTTEAAKTCLMSRRWRYLWRHSANLEFYDSDGDERTHIQKVDKILKSHQAPYLHQFKVGIFCNFISSSPNIDHWIEFAIEKQAQLFELNLLAGVPPLVSVSLFPNIDKLMATSGNLKLSKFCCNLKSLTLLGVEVDEEVLLYFLSNCPWLEELCVSGSDLLRNFKVTCPLPSLKSMKISDCYKLISLHISGPQPSLKSMEISYCLHVKSLEINASNLVSFTYIGPDIVVPFQNCPPELTIGDDYCYSFIFDVAKHTNYLSKLKKLKLDDPIKVMEKMRTSPYPDHFHNFPTLENLRELELKVCAQDGESLLFFNTLTKASPLLSRFTAKIICREVLPQEFIELARDNDSEARRATRFVHRHLKVVKIIGFTGGISDYNLALHLLEIGGSIEKMILKHVSDDHHHRPEFECKALIRKRSKQLEAKLPPGAKLVNEYSCNIWDLFC